MWNTLLKGCKWPVFPSKWLLRGTVPPTFLAQALTNHHFVQEGDILKMNLNSEDFHDDCVDLLKEPVRNKQTVFNEEMNKVKRTM